METALSVRQLHSRGPACRGLAVDSQGVVLGSSHVLVRRASNGYQVADFGAAERLLKVAFGERYDVRHLFIQLEGVKRALSDGNLVKAQILGLQTPLAGISGDELGRLDLAATLLKYDPSQPRDDAGRWTAGAEGSKTDGAQTREAFKAPESVLPEVPVSTPSVAPAVAPAIDSLTPGVLGVLGRLVAAVSAPLLLGGLFALIPTNGSNIHEGDIPGRPDLGYRSDEGILTIFRQDDQGNIQRVFEGAPGEGNFYRDSGGRVIGQHVGTGVVFDISSLPLFGGPLDSPSSTPDRGPSSSSEPSVGVEEPENCPPPTVEIDNGDRSVRAMAYQSQITGLLPGFVSNTME